MTETTIPELNGRQRLDLEKIYYVPCPGEPALYRSLSDLKGYLIGRGIQYNELPDDKGLIVYESADHYVYYDEKGQIIKNRYLGDKGSMGDKGTNQYYVYDSQGRLTCMRQTILPVKGDEILVTQNKYEYPENEPSDHYIRTTINHKGEQTQSTYADRVAERDSPPQF